MDDASKPAGVQENGVPYRPQPSPRSINLHKSDIESSISSSTINSSSGDLANRLAELQDGDEIISGCLAPSNGDTDPEPSSRESIGFNVSGLNVTVIEVNDNKSRDGSDSGVESTPVFHRAFSCGYSSGGFDDLNKSCDSSLLSYSEDTELMTQSLTLFARDGTSEGGSESSVLDSDAVLKTSAERKCAVKKKVVSKSNRSTPVNSSTTDTNTVQVNRRQNITPKRFNSAPTKKPEKEMSPVPKSDKNYVASAKVRSISNLEPRSQNKLKDTHTLSVAKKPSSTTVKPKIAAKPNFSTSTTPRSKTTIATEYDGRWPSSSNRTPTPHKSRVATDTKTPISKTNNIAENSKVFDRFGTLPRRSRKRSPETSKDSVRSFSMNRDTSISRTRKNVRDISKTLPPFPRRKTPKTRIYHEISVQTALTSSDVEKALEGICIKEPRLDSIETKNQEIQVDTSIEDVKKLESKVKCLVDENNQLTESVKLQKESLNTLGEQLAEATAARESIKEELSKTDSRLLVMLGKCKEDGGSDSLQELETHLQSSGQIVIRQQKEIFHLQTINRSLQRDLDKSLAAQKETLKQQQEAEAESQEMQEFLLAEKTFLADELRNAEAEVALQLKNVAQKVSEFERKQEECNHLVRISEQRRQENLTLQGRLNGLDQRSKDLLLQQGAAVSGASVALSGLSTRLEGLVDQLVVSYDISEKDLEDVIFHNEAYSKSNGSSAIASPEKTLNFHQPNPSPQRRASFLTAVVRAIRNATNQTPFSSKKIEQEEQEQPVDAPIEEVSQAEVKDPSPTTESSEEEKSASSIANSESLNNLSQAILRRKQFEDGTEDLNSIMCDGNNESIQELDDFAHGSSFIDQIIAVDNLVTKLLKILRIIQLENDTNVDELQDERVQLEAEVRREQDLRRSTQEEMRSQELVAARLRGEVQEAKLLLQRRVEELEQTKTELQMHREQVTTLSNDNWKLSSAQRELQNCDDEAKGVLQKWQETGEMPSPDSVAWIVSARDEIPALKQQLAEKEMQLEEMGHKFSANKDLLTQNLHQAANEIRRQYEAIDNALEILHSIQGVVVQCPPLAKLQRDLEETNFDCASSQPIVAADLNANAAPMSLNEIHNGGLDAVVTNTSNVMSGAAY